MQISRKSSVFKKYKYLTLSLLLLVISKFSMAIEEPKYQVIKADLPYELRLYDPMLIAEVNVEGDRDTASSKGFRLIADFIFGNNENSTKGAEKISMTAPVTIEPQKIAMTAPVTMESSGESGGRQIWRVHFVMPSEYNMQTLPKPKNSEVRIREIPSKHFVVYRYTGLNGEEKISRNTKELITWMSQQGLQMVGTPQLARYNPPWTLPPFRRNEILIEVATQK